MAEITKELQLRKDSIEYYLYESNLDLNKIVEHIGDFASNEISKWQVRGRYENTIDYEKRITPLNRQQKIDDLVKSSINNLASQEIVFGIKQAEYDADNEVYKLIIRSLPAIYIEVPIADNEASSFESNILSLIFSKPDYALTTKGFALISLIITNPSNGKTYRYHYQDSLTFKGQKVVNEYEPLKISIGDYVANTVIKESVNDKEDELPLLDQKEVASSESAGLKASSSKITNFETNKPGKRIALVIGNGNYIGSILANPENDARSMTDILKKLGFEVYSYKNLNGSQMKRAIDEFGSKLKGNDVGLFYYAGHGLQAKGYNYLIPVDAQLTTEEQVEYDCVRADRVLALMETSGTKVNVIVLDACRNNPFERSWTRSPSGGDLHL